MAGRTDEIAISAVLVFVGEPRYDQEGFIPIIAMIKTPNAAVTRSSAGKPHISNIERGCGFARSFLTNEWVLELMLLKRSVMTFKGPIH